MEDSFSVKCSYKNDEVILEIDLKLMDAELVNQTVSIVLSIMNLAKEQVQYQIDFVLICKNEDYCEPKSKLVFSTAPETTNFKIG